MLHLRLNMSLPSGCCAALSLGPTRTVFDLKTKAQQSLGRGFLRLAAPMADFWIQNKLFKICAFKVETALLLWHRSSKELQQRTR